MFTRLACRRASRQSCQRGLTMVELVIFIVVVSVGVVGILGVLNLTSSRSGDPQLRKQALSIAEALLEEIQLARFTFCDPADANAEQAQSSAVSAAGCASTPEVVGSEPGNARPFDNVNDYVSAFGTPTPYTTDVNGNAIAVTGNYNASVTVTQSGFGGIPANDALLISVTVSYNNSDAVTVEGFRTRYAPRAVP